MHCEYFYVNDSVVGAGAFISAAWGSHCNSIPRWLYCVHRLIVFSCCLTSCFAIWIHGVEEAERAESPLKVYFSLQSFFFFFFFYDEDKLSEMEDGKRRLVPSQSGRNLMSRVWYAASCMTHLIKKNPTSQGSLSWNLAESVKKKKRRI